MVILQRFYAVHSFDTHDRFEVAVACILLAAKTEESPRKLTTVIQECLKLKTSSARKSGKSGGDDGSLNVNSQEFIRLKERTLLLERVILHTIGFELSIDHPHKFIVEKLQKFMSSKQIEFIKPPPPEKKNEMMNSVQQKAVSFANDSLYTCLCLQYPSEKIAVAVLYMSAEAHKMRPANNRSWFALLHDYLDMECLVSIVKQILELIADRKGVDKSLFSVIDSDLKAIKQEYRGGGGGGERDRDPKRQRSSK